MANRLATFIQESRVELKKVTWPAREETVRSTLSVVVMSAVVAAFLGGLDSVFRLILDTFLL